jgi:hypothetical protein
MPLPLTGSTLTKYNALPCVPQEEPLGDLLNGMMTSTSLGTAKATNTSLSNTTTPVEDLNVALATPGLYRVSLQVQVTIDSDVPGLQLGLAPLNGAVFSTFTGFRQSFKTATAPDFDINAASFSINGVGSAGTYMLIVEGTLGVTTPGDIGITWVPIVSSADAVTVFQGSSLVAYKLDEL